MEAKSRDQVIAEMTNSIGYEMHDASQPDEKGERKRSIDVEDEWTERAMKTAVRLYDEQIEPLRKTAEEHRKAIAERAGLE